MRRSVRSVLRRLHESHASRDVQHGQPVSWRVKHHLKGEPNSDTAGDAARSVEIYCICMALPCCGAENRQAEDYRKRNAEAKTPPKKNCGDVTSVAERVRFQTKRTKPDTPRSRGNRCFHYYAHASPAPAVPQPATPEKTTAAAPAPSRGAPYRAPRAARAPRASPLPAPQNGAPLTAAPSQRSPPLPLPPQRR